MKIAVIIGHSKLKNGSYTCASGYKNEYNYCKRQANSLVKYLKNEGHNITLIQCPEGVFIEPLQEKDYKLNLVNGKGFDLVVELHLNAFDGTAYGSEALYTSTKGKEYATRISDKLGTVFKNRGAKKRNNLYILTQTDCPAVIVESFFCDNTYDTKNADKVGVDVLARLIAEGILNKTINTEDQNETTNGNIYYRVVAGSFNDIDNANKKIEELKKKSITDVFIAKYENEKGIFYRVVAGSFNDIDNANKKVEELKKKGITDVFIAKYEK